MRADEYQQQQLEHQLWLKAREANKELKKIREELKSKNQRGNNAR